MSSTDIPAIIARTFVPKVLVDHRSSKSRNVLDTVISLVSMSPMPAPIHNAFSASIRDASALGGSGGARPVSLIAAMSGSFGKPPCKMSHVYEATMPPWRTTRTISVRPLLGLGTKNMTSAMTAASKDPSENGRVIASPCLN